MYVTSSNSSPSSHLSRTSMNIHKLFRLLFIHSQCVCVCAHCYVWYKMNCVSVLCAFVLCADDNHTKRLPHCPDPFPPIFDYQPSMIFILCVFCVFVVLQPIIHHMSNVVVVFFFQEKRLFFVCNKCIHCTSSSMGIFFSFSSFFFQKKKKKSTNNCKLTFILLCLC